MTLARKRSTPEVQALSYAWTSGVTLSSGAANPTFTASDRTRDYARSRAMPAVLDKPRIQCRCRDEQDRQCPLEALEPE